MINAVLMNDADALRLARAAEALVAEPLPGPYPEWVLFISAGNPDSRAEVSCGRGDSFANAWQAALAGLTLSHPRWLRVDVVERVEALRWGKLREKFSRTKRSYFRFGLSFDPGFEHALLEQELAANAILYHSQIPVVAANHQNLERYAAQRFGAPLQFPEAPETPVWRFTTRGLFYEDGQLYSLCSQGREAGYRELKAWPGEYLPQAIVSASDYLVRQIHDDGRYDYGWFPCFDKPVPAYNALRHASTTYALLESWELTRCPQQFAAIERALDYLTTRLIHSRPLPDGRMADFLVDEGNEVKLGGNAVAILALAKYSELTGDTRYFSQMNRLAHALRFMQDPTSGIFIHVLNFPDLTLKAVERIIYYDGEAAFALMRLYGLTGQQEWLEMVELAFDSFIAREHWRAHDHWLSYCVNELVAYRPQEKYFKFGLDNVRDHLDFVLERVTTYPTLLELMMAAESMLTRLAASEYRHLLIGFDRDKFDRALEHRARYLMNGFFWPELAMFFANPQRIIGSFFIRHHAWRVRIDDVEHYLSGYVAWLKYQRRQQRQPQELMPLSGPQLLFLGEDLREVGNGIEVAMLRRAQLFAEWLKRPATLVLCAWNPDWRKNVEVLRHKGLLPATTAVRHIYDGLLAMRDRGELWPLKSGMPRQLPLPEALHRRQQFSGAYLEREEFIDAYGQLLLCKYYRPQPGGSPRLERIQWRNGRGELRRFDSEESLNSWLLSASLDNRLNWHFIVDKNAPWRQFVMQPAQRPRYSTLSAMIHNTHRLTDGRLKQTYAHLLNAPHTYDRLLVLTEEQRDDLFQEGFPVSRLQVIPHPITSHPQPPKEPGQKVLYMARYSPEKQHELLIRVFAQVVERLPKARLVCHGSGPLRARLAEQVAALNLQSNIAINGYCEELAALHQKCQCAVLCSSQEGFSQFAQESLSFGTPLVTFAIKYGPRDLLGNFEAGILVTPDDEQALAQALITLLSSPERLQSMSLAARHSVKRFAPEAIAGIWQEWWNWAQQEEGRLPPE
ncbi:glycosyl transferase [Salmonella enterica subsp. enterica serovar Choleraesuis]|nr:glycosyl transferase [Salmonella enterica subsp. enterica serovar Choleraesuis]